VRNATASPFLVGLEQMNFDYPGLGIVVQSLLRHVMSPTRNGDAVAFSTSWKRASARGIRARWANWDAGTVEQMNFDYPGLGIVVQSLLRHVMSQLLCEGIVNKLLVTNEERRRGRVLDVLEEGFGEGNQGEVGELGCRN
jgi:hypothetical protein